MTFIIKNKNSRKHNAKRPFIFFRMKLLYLHLLTVYGTDIHVMNAVLKVVSVFVAHTFFAVDRSGDENARSSCSFRSGLPRLDF